MKVKIMGSHLLRNLHCSHRDFRNMGSQIIESLLCIFLLTWVRFREHVQIQQISTNEKKK